MPYNRDTMPLIWLKYRTAFYVVHRYLKGLCDKTDGSCPLSHKISKEKVHCTSGY